MHPGEIRGDGEHGESLHSELCGWDSVFPYSDDAHVVRMIQRAGIPLVLVDRAVEGAAVDAVRLDDYQGGVLAAEHLYGAGHRKFAYICGPETMALSLCVERDLRTGLRSTG